MLGDMMKNRAKEHVPAALRQTGLTVLKFYAIGAVLVVVYSYFIGAWALQWTPEEMTAAPLVSTVAEPPKTEPQKPAATPFKLADPVADFEKHATASNWLINCSYYQDQRERGDCEKVLYEDMQKINSYRERYYNYEIPLFSYESPYQNFLKEYSLIKSLCKLRGGAIVEFHCVRKIGTAPAPITFYKPAAQTEAAKPAAEAEAATPPPTTTLEPRRADWVQRVLSIGFFVALAFYLFFEPKYGLARMPLFVPKGYQRVLAGLVTVILAGLGFHAVTQKANFWEHFKTGFLVVFVPYLLMTFRVYSLIIWEYIKETDLYRNWAIIGQKQATARFGGLREYMRGECTDLIRQTTAHGAPLEQESTFFLGKTSFLLDYKLGTRYMGIKGQNHKILVAPSGTGKSLESLTAALTMWQGGGLIFDIKGEHWQTVISKKAGEKYLFDPYGVIDKNHAGEGWNPLIEIDPNSGTAREDLARMCDAIFLETKGGAGNAMHFKEVAMKAVRGIMAHVRTTYPPELQHLGTVYDLFMYGHPKGTEPPRKPLMETYEGEENGKKVKKTRPAKHPSGKPVMIKLTPLECFNKLIIEMLNNDKCGGAAKDAAITLERLEARERSGVMSTAYRAIDWVNGEKIRPLLSAKKSFSLDVIKRGAWVNLCITSQYLDETMLFIRLFFQRALDMVDEYRTPNAKDHKRRMLFLFEEFDKFGFQFKPAIDVVNFKRSSRVMGVFVLQNIGQLVNRYDNVDNFLSNCDTIYLGIKDDEENLTAERISKAIGKRPDTTQNGEASSVMHMNAETVTQALKAGNMFVFPAGKDTKPLYLRRVQCYKIFPWTKY